MGDFITFKIEKIPDEDHLYLRVHKNNNHSATETYVPAEIFKPQGDSMSTEWNKYSNPLQALNNARKPSENSIASLNIGKVRLIPLLKVIHDPSKANQAHTSVYGIDGDRTTKMVIQRKLSKIAVWEIYQN